MKTILIILGALGLIFVIVQVIYYYKIQSNIETYPYEVVKDYDTFEIRNYEASLFTSVKLNEGNYKETSSKGFSVLAGYIFGDNKKNEKIAMTSPVAMTIEDNSTMMFMVPGKFNKEDLPEPTNNAITFKEMPAKKVAAITFGGWANDEKINEYKEKLVAALKASNIKHTNNFYFFGYNAPFEIIKRKNEVIVELE
ncbi:heme-binding protein [Hyunsoonleella flava]|uniref:Heme-binding protein n=2 Tax=Hyunsoonleella flava TaxID=2527939 RepID=A0A4Q9FDE5_9FLAO|nr:heme-binding protein [Hyunsoonleella flava]